MKRKLIFCSILLLGYATVNAQTQFWSDQFEDTGSPSAGSRVLSLAEFSCNSPATAYFKRTNGTDINPTTYSSFQGSKFFAAMDIDRGPTCTNLSISAGQSITWSGINIAGKHNLAFSGLFGANSAAVFQGLYFANASQNWAMDSMAVECRIDGGAWTKIIGIYPNNNTASGGPIAVDNDGDRIGDGTALGLALSEVSANIIGTGNSLDLRFDIYVNNGVPGSMAFDNFRLFENAPLWSDNFEDVGAPSTGSRTLSLAEFSCNSPATAYFKRTDGTDINPTTYSNFQGSKFFAAMDIDRGPTCTNLSISAGQSITWSKINIAGRTNLFFNGLFGANSAAVFQGLFFASSGQMDSMAVECRIDGGAWTKIIGIYSNNSTASGGPIAVDNDGDRVGDGATLGLALSEVSAGIPGTGSLMDLRFDIYVNNGVPGSMAFDNFRLLEGTPLAVTLSSFTAIKENNTAGLYWTTAKETDNAGFDIQRSIDGKVYQIIGTVASKAPDGNSKTTLSYSFTDRAPFTGMNFYRLMEKGIDGNSIYSDVRVLNFDGKANFNCYPNPVHSQLVVEYNAVKEESMNIRITDIMGKVVMTQAMHVQKDFNRAYVDMSSLAQGIYNMAIISNSGVAYTSKITKD